MHTNADVKPSWRRSDAPVALGLFTAFLLIYLRTLCPTVYLGDSGAFCMAIAAGGVPQPPGSPLFGLLGRAALAMIPVGEPGFRIGCVVAAGAATAVVVLYFLARELGASRWAALTGAGVFGLSFTFWSQSNRVEAYSLHVLLSGLVLLAALRYRRDGRIKDLALGTAALSLGLAHHLTIVLLIPSLLVLGGRRLLNDPGPGRRLAVMSLMLSVGPALYLLLLVWVHAEPLHAWGHTANLPLLLNHASARIFRIFMAVPQMSDIPNVAIQASGLFQDNFPFLTWVLPILGIALLWMRDRRLAVSLLLLPAAIGGCNLSHRIDDIAACYLPAWFVGAALLALALEAIRSVVYGPGISRPWVAITASCLLLGALLLRNWDACDLSRATWARDFARHKLQAAAPRSVLITHGDDDINPIWYVHDVLMARPDVTPIDRAWAAGRTWGRYAWDPSLLRCGIARRPPRIQG